MKNLKVWIEQEGKQKFVGTIQKNGSNEGQFAYDETYLQNADSRAISLNLPLQEGFFSQKQTEIFFDGLLPEGFMRRAVAERMQTDERDYLGILEKLGNECLGAIRITSSDNMPEEADYVPLKKEQVQELAKEGVSLSTEMVTKAHLSLTGASGKVGLYYNESEDAWYLPTGAAPSTHIVKLSHVRLNSIVVNEKLCMMTAKSMGIDVPDSFIINTGNGLDGEVLFATTRYDRILSGTQAIGELPQAYRLHQEDFAQAMGIPAGRKYEPKEEQYLKKMMDTLRRYSANPIADQQALWDMLAYDYLIGNTDNHIKNFSLLYSNNLKTLRLAPCYDVISTMIYKSSADEMAMAIGETRAIQEINRESFAVAAEQAGLGAKAFLRRVDNMASKLEPALRQNAKQLQQEGFAEAPSIAEKVLQNGGIAYWK